MKHSNLSRLNRCVAAALMLSVGGSHAGVATWPLTISARYQQTCSIFSTPQFDFGTLPAGPGAPAATTAGVLLVECSATSQGFGVWAPLSANAITGSGQRRVKSNDATPKYINYDIYYGSSTTKLSTTSLTSGYASGSASTSSVYTQLTGVQLRAVLPAGQILAQGYYSDTLVLTVSY